MPGGCGAPPASRNVGARSIRLTKSSTTRPGAIWPGQRAASDLATDVVEIAFGSRKPRYAVIAADDNQRVVEFADRLQPLQQHAESAVHGLAFAQIIGNILANLVDVRQEWRQLPLQRIGIDAPERAAAAALPFPVRVARPPPVAERLAGRTGIEEGVEIPASFVIQRLLGAFDPQFRGARGRVLGETVERVPGLHVTRAQPAVRGVHGEARRPDLVRVADVVAVSLQNQRIARNGFVPAGALKDGAEAAFPEIATGQDRTAAGGAGRRGHEGIRKQDAIPNDAVDMGRLHEMA